MKYPTILDRLRARTVAQPAPFPFDDECLIWTGFKKAGYGRVTCRVPGCPWPRTFYAHRIAWEVLRGPIPPEMTIDHLCRHPGCWNVAHLEMVTNSENARRRWARSEVILA